MTNWGGADAAHDWRGGGGFTADLDADGEAEILTWGDGDKLDDDWTIGLYARSVFTTTGEAEPTVEWLVPVEDVYNSHPLAATADADYDGDAQGDLAVSVIHSDAEDVLAFYSGPLTAESMLDQPIVEVSKDYLGLSLSSGDDLDGDGVDELVVAYMGGVLVMSPRSLEGVVAFEDAGPALAFSGDQGDSPATTARAGDHDGDGLADLLVGSTAWAGLYLGPVSDGDQSDAYATFGSEEAPESLSVASGDFDGNGQPDVAVGAAGSYSDRGAAWVTLGPATGSTHLDLEAEVAILGYESGHNVGASVASAGDTNADGVDDLLVGANAADCEYGWSDFCEHDGAAAVFLFESPFVEASPIDVRCASIQWEGPDRVYDGFGTRLSGGVDFDGSGGPDFLVTAGYDEPLYLFLDP